MVGEIGGKTKGGKKGGSNDAFTFKSYFNSCLRLQRKANPATFIGQYFLRLIGCTCSAFPLSLSAKTNSYAIAVMSGALRSLGSDFSLATPLIGISKLESAPATGVIGTLPLIQSPISTFVIEL